MNSIIQYMQNRAPGYSHPTINSFFYWGAQLLPWHCRIVNDTAWWLGAECRHRKLPAADL